MKKQYMNSAKRDIDIIRIIILLFASASISINTRNFQNSNGKNVGSDLTKGNSVALHVGGSNIASKRDKGYHSAPQNP